MALLNITKQYLIIKYELQQPFLLLITQLTLFTHIAFTVCYAFIVVIHRESAVICSHYHILCQCYCFHINVLLCTHSKQMAHKQLNLPFLQNLFQMGTNQGLPARRFPQTPVQPRADLAPPPMTPLNVSMPQIGQRRGYAQFTQPSAGPVSPSEPKLLQTFGKTKEPLRVPPEEVKIEPLSSPRVTTTEVKEDVREYREAVQMLDEYLLVDEKYIELEQELLLEPKEAAYRYHPNEMFKVASVPIPGLITSQYQSKKDVLQCCLSGIWPEIRRVFITIDNRLFLWNYQNTADVATFEPVTLPIEALALSKSVLSLNRILPPSAPYALWIATEAEIRLFGLEVSPILNLVATGFSVSPEGDKLNKIVATLNGRVFYGGSEGHLNEINYSEATSWFSNKAKMVKQDRTGSWLGSLIPSFFTFTGRYSIEDIALDETRHVLYTFQVREKGEKSTNCFIGVYDLGAYGTGFAEICRISQADLMEKVEMQDERLRDMEMKIVGVSPIEQVYSESIQLLVTCSNGIRIYLSFDTEKREESVPMEEVTRAGIVCDTRMRSEYKIVAIKFPPQTVHPSDRIEGLDISGFINSIEGVQNVDKVFQSKNNHLLLLSDLKGERATSSFILISSNEPELAYLRNLPPGKAMSQLKEIVSCIEDSTEGPITDLCEDLAQNKLDRGIMELLGVRDHVVTDGMSPPNYIGQRRKAYTLGCMHELAKSVYIPAMEYYTLTTQSFTTYIKPRGVDYLAQVLYVEPNIDSVVDKYGKVETCTMLLSLLCNLTEGYYVEIPEARARVGLSVDRRAVLQERSIQIIKLDKKLRDRARKYFFDLGNTVTLEDESRKMEPRTRFLDTYGVAATQSVTPHSGKAQSQQRIAKLASLYLYVGRIVRPIWDQYVTKCTSYNPNLYFDQEGMWNERQRRVVQYKLIELRQFLEENSESLFNLHVDPKSVTLRHSLITIPGLEGYYKTPHEKLETLILRERKQIENLHRLILKMVEGLELLSFMDDQEAFEQIQSHLTLDSQKALAETVFKHVVYQQLSNDFLTTLITHYLNVKKMQGVDALKLASDLNQKCSNYFTRSHYEVYRAEILLEKALRLGDNRPVQTNTIKEATAILFENLAIVDIERIVPLFLSLDQYSTAKKLCLAVAAEQDRLAEGEGSAFAAQADTYKKTCYSYVIDLLEELHNTIIGKVKRKEEDIFHGVFDKLSTDQLLELEDMLISECANETKDETFHLTLFRWLAEKQMLDKLLKLQSPYLDQFIRNRFDEATSSPSELLYKYFMAKGFYRKAAEVLYALATLTYAETAEGSIMTLEDRVQYLNFAIDCIDQLDKEGKDNKLQKAQEVEDCKFSIEMCKESIRLQITTLNHIKELYKKSPESDFKHSLKMSITELEERLIDSHELYEKYAKRFELWEIAIKILANEIRDITPTSTQVEELTNCYKTLVWKTYTDNPLDWPANIIRKVIELAKLYYWPIEQPLFKERAPIKIEMPKNADYLFPVEAIVKQAEIINMRHFEMKEGLLVDQPVEAYVGKPEFWVITFLRSDSMKMRFEDIYELYGKLEGEDAENLKWGLRTAIAQIVCCILWTININEGKYDKATFEKCKDAAKKATQNAKVLSQWELQQKKLKMLGKTVPPYTEAYVTEIIEKVNDLLISPPQVQTEIRPKVDIGGSIQAVKRRSLPPSKERKNKEDLVKEFQASVNAPSPQQFHQFIIIQ
eukprot:TRINITY_DN1463_c0_g1_i3.p1 TRINITY_DN1463_c0_g1~~TRINITY_DN1463_c0_g1_i3.p1  ORF type:complete len:1707 (-),score=155.69 TRINITY_DN1463_c0_g1_i3:10852-15972(-)